MIPWTAINLVDFYFLRHGDYDVHALFDANGKYGKFNWIALGVYFATVLIELPFANAVLYQGPIALAMNGADISWLVGGIFACGNVYYFLVKMP